MSQRVSAGLQPLPEAPSPLCIAHTRLHNSNLAIKGKDRRLGYFGQGHPNRSGKTKEQRGRGGGKTEGVGGGIADPHTLSKKAGRPFSPRQGEQVFFPAPTLLGTVTKQNQGLSVCPGILFQAYIGGPQLTTTMDPQNSAVSK